MTVSAKALSGAVQIRVTRKTYNPLVGAALATFGVTHKPLILNHARNAKTGLLRHAAETAFYVANTPVTATRGAESIRAHWRIESVPQTHTGKEFTVN